MFSWLKKGNENKKQNEEIAQLKKQLDEVNEKLKKVSLEKSSPGASHAVGHQPPSQISPPPYAPNLPSGGLPQLMNLPNFQTPPPPFLQFQPHPVPQNYPQSYSGGPPPFPGPVVQQQTPGSAQPGVPGQPPPPYYSNQGTTSSGQDTRHGMHFRGASQDTRHYQGTGQRGFRNPKFERGRRNDSGYRPGKPRTDNRNLEENKLQQNQRSHQNDLAEDRPLFLKTEDNMKNPQDRNRPTYFRGWRGRGRGGRGGVGRGGYNNSYNSHSNSNSKGSNDIATGKSQQCQPRPPCNEKKSEDQGRISKSDSGSESQSESDIQEKSRDSNLKSSFKTTFKKPRPKPRTVKNTEWVLVGSELAGVPPQMSSPGSSFKVGVSSPSLQTNTPDLIKFVHGSEEELTSVSLNNRKPKSELVLTRNCMGPNDVFKKFIGSEIPSFAKACRMNIDLETKVRDVVLSSGPPANQLVTPKTLLDIVMYKVKYPGAKAVLL